LNKIIVEPKASNKGPNNLFAKLGFEIVKTYETIPHPVCFKQIVNRYEISPEQLGV